MKSALAAAKILLPIVILGGLCWHVWRQHPEAIDILRSGGTRTELVVAAFGTILSAHLLCFVRWHLLMRALALPVRLRDTLRLGFLAHLLNFVSPGQVGGDLFKAVFIARSQPTARTEAVASIVVDRLCGLLGLLLVAAAATWAVDAAHHNGPLRSLAIFTSTAAALGAVMVLGVIAAGQTVQSVAARLARIPRLGIHVQRIVTALQLFRSQPRVLAAVAMLSLAVHLVTALGVYLVSIGLYRETPTLAQHLVISPLAGSAAALPLTPGGLGSFELAFSFLYNQFSAADAQGRGVIVGLVVHLAIISCAGYGVILYWLNYRELRQLLRAAEGMQPSDPPPKYPGTTVPRGN